MTGILWYYSLTALGAFLMNILVADDKPDISNLVRIYLEKDGYTVFTAEDGREALSIFNEEKINLCIFDVMMPEIDGYSLVQIIRKTSDVPIIMLTAKTMTQDIILGLDLGADDYVCKPFNSLELVSRVNARIRRMNDRMSYGAVEKYGELEIDRDKCSVSIAGRDCGLTSAEYRILMVLLNSPDQVFTKNQLYNKIFGKLDYKDENTITVHISRLREKLGDNSKIPRYITTIRGLGYKLNEQQ